MQRFLLYAQGRKITFHVLCLQDECEVLSNHKQTEMLHSITECCINRHTASLTVDVAQITGTYGLVTELT